MVGVGRVRGRGLVEGKGDNRTTPETVWRPLLIAAGLECWTLDPASNPHSTIPATVTFDGTLKGGDGLGPLYWMGDVYLNPPFSRMLAWAQRAIAELDPVGRLGLRSLTFLALASLGTRWHDLMVRGCDAFATWKRREDFPIPGLPSGTPPAAPIVYYGGPEVERWRDRLEGEGHLTHAGRRGGGR